MRIITLINQKGGTGKTTTAINVGAALSRCGLMVLLVDVDPQGNLSQSAGFDELSDNDITTYEVLKGEDINKAIKSTDSYDVLPTDIGLSAAEIELGSNDDDKYLLKKALGKLKKSYDVIIIDSPPSFNILSLMALTAATEVVIPVQAMYLPLKGVAQLRETIELVKAQFNPELEIGGVVLTFFDERRNLDRDVLDALEQAFEGKVFKTKISQNTKIAEAPSYGKDVIAYSPSSKGSKQYIALAKELVNHETTEKRGKRNAKKNGK